MKRFLLALIFMTFLGGSVFAEYAYPDIPQNAVTYYSQNEKKWSLTPLKYSIKFTKRYTTGQNRFSEYAIEGLGFDTNSTREFISNGDLIGYNQSTLKFHRIYFENGRMKKEQLNEKEIRTLFPGCEIIRVSQFKDNSIKIKRNPFKSKTYLLMNDTNTMFYGYSFKGLDNTKEAFNCIFTPERNGKIEFLPPEKSVTYTPYYIRLKYVL